MSNQLHADAKASFRKFLRRFGANIRRMRMKRGWTRKEVADHTGFSLEWIVAIEKGRLEVDLKKVHWPAGVLSLASPEGFDPGQKVQRRRR